jgi:hypothetical protein
MARRKSGVFHPAEEILVMTCAVCERFIGYQHGRGPRSKGAA